MREIKIPFRDRLGKTVKTPDGVGVLISVQTPHDAVAVQPQYATYLVWYGMDNVQSGKVSWEYRSDDLELP